MKYFSTNRQSPEVDFRQAAINGLAPDRGLYFPERIPTIEKKWIDEIGTLTNEEIALKVIAPYVGDSIPASTLLQIVSDTVNFPIPLVKIRDNVHSLELYHGPTLAFKDIGARFMSRCLGYFLGGSEKKVTVLVATSGDTGGAVASGFYNVKGVDVVILYPSGKVSPVQEKQLTALGQNIHALEVAGTFDDCQAMVKQAFADKELNKDIFLTSANSINVARWLPQQFYYFFACKQWPHPEQPPVISVPSGNFGNICAGMLASASGLPVSHFIAACNINDVVSGYLNTGELKPKPAKPTFSNAMDVGDPSNFVRILEIFQHQFPKLKEKLSSYVISDDETLQTIERVYRTYDYLLDPHGAVGLLALERYLAGTTGSRGLFLETAHPVKFPDAVEKAAGINVPVPVSLRELMLQPKKSVSMPAQYSSLRDYLLK